MAQTTTAFPNTAVSADGALETTWTTPNNVFSDNATNASVSLAALGNSGRLDGTQFNLLSEDAGSLVGTGVKIPTGASILGVRLVYEYSLSSGNSPTVTLSGTAHSSAGVVQAMAIRSYGWGTLQTGSTVSMGNTFSSNDLSVESGQNSARASLSDPGLVLSVKGSNGAGLNSAAYAVDFLRVEVSWILRKDASGSAFSLGFGSGEVKETVIKAGDVADGTVFGSGEIKETVLKVGDVGDSTAFASGIAKPIVSASGSTTSTANAAGVGSVIATRSGIATTFTFASGVPTSQATQTGTASSTGFASGQPSETVIKAGDVADSSAFGSGVPKPIITTLGSASASSLAAGLGTSTITRDGVATSYAFVSGSVAAIATEQGVGSSNSLASGVATGTATIPGAAVSYSFASGQASQAITRDGVGTAASEGYGEQHSIFTLPGTGTSNAVAAGVARAYSFAISGYAYDQASTPLVGARTDIYRTSDHQHMGRVFTGPTGYYSLAIPNQPETFWVRWLMPGPPVIRDTTDDDRILVESQVQGPP